MAGGGPYKVRVSGQAKTGLKKTHDSKKSALRDAIDSLANEPRPDGCTKLAGQQSTYRIAVGRDLRVVYEVDDWSRTVTVKAAGSREGMYGKKGKK